MSSKPSPPSAPNTPVPHTAANTVTNAVNTRNQRRYRKLALPSAANTPISLSFTYIVICNPYDVR
ncbi:hypothetical protein Pme01_03420 [Planosporangium mesophilum]|uniref:Uncharacterized protein n=1 Tax=Planosporangium mesophilum TaxID=689768 RepID=A0A8J3TFU7_9ACTN|nr:hypothetical protein Pme01_03420 [Planosporangium mesophilum]